MMLLTAIQQTLLVLLAYEAWTGYAYNPRPYANALRARQSGGSSSLRVDLGYEIYDGMLNSTSGLNIWRGYTRSIPMVSTRLTSISSIRFAAPPTDANRWQAPQPPEQNRSSPINASSYAPICPQAPDASYSIHAVNQTGSDEDCLFLNVYAPANASGPLPVLVWIHGGGYGAGNGRLDFSTIINANNNGFIGVAIQYRVRSPSTCLQWVNLLIRGSWAHLDFFPPTKSSAMEWSTPVFSTR